jgi:soluble lytic murein transglycosylase-like protein
VPKTATTDPVLHWEGYAVEAEHLTGVPAEVLLGLVSVESGGKEGLTSSAGAGGLTQFMPGTAKTYGVDTRPGHARSQIIGAAKYLKALGYDKDPKHALAAYNGGPGNAHLAVTQKYADNVLAAAKRYKGAVGASKTAGRDTKTPAPRDTSDGSEWGGGLLSPLFEGVSKGFIYIALIAVAGALMFIGVRRSLTNRPGAA